MYAVRIIHVLVVIPGDRREAGFARLRAMAMSARAVAPTRRAQIGRPTFVSGDDATVNYIQFARSRCNSSAANSTAFSRTFNAPSRVASPVMTVTREA